MDPELESDQIYEWLWGNLGDTAKSNDTQVWVFQWNIRIKEFGEGGGKHRAIKVVRSGDLCWSNRKQIFFLSDLD